MSVTKCFRIVIAGVTLPLVALSFVAPAKEKVILATDMVMLYDDGVAMMMLAKHPDIELLGLTIVPGNTWLSEGTAYALRQLEVIKRRDAPVASGTRYPLRAGRYETMEIERKMFGIGPSHYVGCFGWAEPSSYLDVYREKFGGAPTIKPLEKYGPTFEKNPDYIRLVWDTIAAAVVIDPTLIVEEETRWVDVNSDYGLDYGRSLGYHKQGPAGTQRACIAFSTDAERFWNLMVNLLTR